MTTYTYTAKNRDGKTARGTMEAKSEQDLFVALREQQLLLVDCRESKIKSLSYKLKSMEVAEFSRQISDMLGSGVPVTKALEILRDCALKPQLKKIMERLHTDVQNGETLSEAMREQGETFPALFINMYSAGEVSGRLQNTAQKMAEHYEKEHKLSSKVRSAMIYPTLLVVVTLLVIVIIFTIVLPQFFTAFEGVELPWITRAVIAFSSFLTNHSLAALLAVLLLIFGVRMLLTVDAVRTAVDRKKLTLPVIGRMNRIICTARFSRTLSSLYSSGLSILQALTVASSIVGNRYIEKQFEPAVAAIRDGALLSQTIGKINGFDRKLAATLVIAEESGRLDSMLENTADNYDFEAEAATTRMVALVEPVMIVIMAVIIGSIVLSVLLPMLNIYNSIGQGV